MIKRAMVRLLQVVPALAVTGLLLTACSAPTEANPEATYARWVDSGDGRKVWCISTGSNLSCDWANTK